MSRSGPTGPEFAEIPTMRKPRMSRIPRADQLARISTAGRLWTAVLLIGLIAAVGIGLVVQINERDRTAAAAAAAVAGPAALADDGTVRFGDTDPVMTITEDMQCPLCRSFDSVSGPAIAGLLDQQKIAVAYRVIAIRDRDSTTEYSSRAANASACVAEADKSKWLAWRRAVLDRVPAQGSPGPTDRELIDLAGRAGITASTQLTDCVTSGRYRAFVANQTKKATEAKLTSVPAVRIGDGAITNLTPEGIEASVQAAAR
ncbi:DsbA family protein [Nocardia sp. NPDC052566]|uniref:DsbA family protein n=1 Tax=Nocardia sp. NPDC052566 TaxID=3364330 RepID=UPI0037C609FC